MREFSQQRMNSLLLLFFVLSFFGSSLQSLHLASEFMAPVQTLAEFSSYNYASIFPEESFFSYFTSPYVPFISVALYLVLSKPICYIIVKLFGITPKGGFLQTLTVTHSAILTIYSAWTCFHSIRIVAKSMNEVGFWATMCGSHEDLWVKRGLQVWVTHFYISKYYEFVDTWIILLKQREPSLLQTFHHAGIAIMMWGLMVTSSSPVLVVLCFNSFIHTLMYTYYVMAALNIKSFLKPYMTSMQILQFVVGLSFTLQTHFIPGCLNPAQDAVMWGMETYTIALILLFGAFFAESYLNNKGGKSTKASHKPVDRIASTSEFLNDEKFNKTQ